MAGSHGLETSRLVSLGVLGDALYAGGERGPLYRIVGGVAEALALPHPTADPVHLVPHGDRLLVQNVVGLATLDADGLHADASAPFDSRFRQLLPDAVGTAWFARTTDTVARVSSDRVDLLWKAADGEVVETLLPDDTGGVWVASTSTLRHWTPSRGIDTAIPWTRANICHLQQLGDRLRLGTKQGTFWLDDGVVTEGPAGDGCRPWASEPGGALWSVRDGWLHRDDTAIVEVGAAQQLLWTDDAVWVATMKRGLFRVRASPLVARDAPPEVPYPVLPEGPDGALVGTWGAGLWRVDGSGDGQVAPLVRAGTDAQDQAISMVRDGAGTVWVATQTGVCRLQGDACAYTPAPARLPQGARWGGGIVGLDPQGAVWSVMAHLVARWDGASWQIWPADGPLTDEAQPLVPTRDGQLLFGSKTGAIVRVTDSGLERFDGPAPLGTTAVRLLTETSDGTLWVGLEDAGLCRVRLPDHRPFGIPPAGPLDAVAREVALDCVDRRVGLPEDTLHTLVDDAFGRVWASTNRGLTWMRRSELIAVLDGTDHHLHPVRFDERHGMRDREANGARPPAYARSGDGALWFPTMGGMLVVDPSAVRVPEVPPIHWRDIRVGGVPRRSDDLSLGASERDLTVRWRSVAFEHPDALHHRYRLEGYEEAWRHDDGSRSARYTNLPPGELAFVVQANLAGTWGPETRLPLRRAPAFVETRAFYALLSLGGFVLAALTGALSIRNARRRQRELEAEVARQTEELVVRNADLSAQRALLSEQAERLSVQNHQIAKQAARLAEQDHQRTRFVANLSHELRTPLTLVTGPARALSAQHDSLPPTVRQTVEVMRRNADRLDELVDQLLHVAQLEAGTLPLAVRPHDLGAFVSRIADRFAILAGERGIRLTTDTPPGIGVFFDGDKIDKVVTNLLSNALKFTPAGGEVALRVSADDAFAVVTVADDGPGLTAEAAARVFERFFQADSGDTRRHQGAGVGLSLCHDLVALHGGEIVVTTAPGAGAALRFTLPIGVSHVQPDELDLSPEDAHDALPIVPLEDLQPPSEDAPEVVLVEDHHDMRAYLATHLATAFAVRPHAGARAALDDILASPPALVVSDVAMPELDGLELARRLRDDPRTASVPILLVSAKTAAADRVAGLAVADDYVTKPFYPGELLARARSLAAPPRRVAPPVDIEVEPALPDHAAEWVQRLDAVIDAHLADETFTVEALAKKMALSRRQLGRQTQARCGATPTAYLRTRRLEAARAFLRRGTYATVSEVAQAVGMSLTYFGRVYRAAYGHPPSQDLDG
jgi:signal transduction histidine kinase/DNA-binding response OmpR family regulator/ligand-binding sensor domain-containing protein